MKKQTLLEEARMLVASRRKYAKATKEDLDLALAFLRKEISSMSVVRVKNGKSNSDVYTFTVRTLRTALEENWITITVKEE